VLDQYLSTVGKLTVHAVSADLYLFSMFRVLSKCDGPTANAIYFSLDSVQAKVQMVRRVAVAAGDEEDGTLLEEIEKANLAAHKPRNELAHALVFTDDPTKGDFTRLSFKNQSQPRQPITPAYLAALMQRSHDALMKAMNVYERFSAKHGVQPVPAVDF
jgi:hypothetical protein